ncbi:methyl-accepting chemotaxis protein [Imhoffiella purpurea]|uniref:Methyl-accepting chemotaxis protein n=1 Tax=Imhoffiella purpurea TaxID=1249627 RepID=W9V777_9GAMM|nr:methyl-accepting chemotaxis protein [Imhoffiella purpurea]EXJ15408.1 Methyl-accepting chemotaxis protein [Imhoffiella purpurea]
MSRMRQITVNTRLWILMGILVMGILIGFGLALFELRTMLMDEKVLQLTKLVETATSIVEERQQMVARGQVDEESAKDAALAALSALRYDQGNYFWVTDLSGMAVMHPIKPELDGTDTLVLTDANGKRFWEEIRNKARTDGKGTVAYAWPKPGSTKAIPKLAYFQTFEPWGWVLATGVYIDDVDDAFWSNTLMLAGFGLTVLLILMALTILTGRSIVLPVREAANAMLDIASGHGDLTKRLETDGRDEISEMASGFNAFAAKTESMVISVSQATTTIASAAEELTAVTETNSAGMERQRGEVQQVATAINQMSATIMEIARNAEQAATSTLAADKSARQGGQTVTGVLEANTRLASEVEQVAASIHRFSDESQSIGGVLDVIRAIAEQTNLLALNAAIEAARAGEQGRGFAVVADEVRTLASRTQQSTSEIQRMIETLRTVAKEAVERIQRGETITAETLDQATHAQDALSEILDSISRIRDMNTQIASAAEEQATVAREIDRNVVNISDLSTESAQHSEHTAAASRELSRLSSELHELVGQFKVGSAQD